MDFTTNFATSMHILSFAAVRYMAVRKPFTVTFITKKKVLPFIICLWISSLLLSLPLLWLMGVDDDRGRYLATNFSCQNILRYHVSTFKMC